MAASNTSPPVQLLKSDGVWGRQTVGILQAFLRTVGEYSGPLDGVWEAVPKRAMLAFLRKSGYHIEDIEAEFDAESVRALQQWLGDSGFPCEGGVDGIWARGTTSSLQQFLNSVKGLRFVPIRVDGHFSPETVRALQFFLVQHGQVRIPIDGGFGSRSRQILQSFLKDRGYYQKEADGNFGAVSITGLRQWLADSGFRSTEADGVWGEGTTRCLQEFLNSQTAEKQVVTITCAVQDSAQLEISCTSLAGENIATLNADLHDSIGLFRRTLANKLELPEHDVELVHPAAKRLENNKITFAELLGAELLSDLLVGSIVLRNSRSNSGFLVCHQPRNMGS